MKKNKPNYYSIIPAEVRYSENISSTAKLIYAEISSLTNKEGFCWANNKYFSDLFNISRTQISNIISKLQKQGFINIEINKDMGNSRKVYINTLQRKPYNLLKKTLIPIKENFKQNTISNIKSNNIDIEFNVFWNLYDKKVGLKNKIEKKWNKLTNKDRKDIIGYIPKYKEAQPEKRFRKNPATFLNNESWKDELISNEKPKKKKPFWQGSSMWFDNAKKKWFVIIDGEFKEFCGEEKEIIYK